MSDRKPHELAQSILNHARDRLDHEEQLWLSSQCQPPAAAQGDAPKLTAEWAGGVLDSFHRFQESTVKPWCSCVLCKAITAIANGQHTVLNADERKQWEADKWRLDWVIANEGAMHIQGSPERGYRILDCSDGLTFVTDKHPTARAAIDDAIAATKE